MSKNPGFPKCSLTAVQYDDSSLLWSPCLRQKKSHYALGKAYSTHSTNLEYENQFPEPFENPTPSYSNDST